MNPLFFASGNLLADRRAGYAQMLFSAGDFRAAAELMGEALSLAPEWAAGHFRHGEILAEAGDLTAATEAWRTALRLDHTDRLGAALKLELHGALPGLEAAPSAFVETLFDQYAGTFDEALVERLAYRVPELIWEALKRLGRERFAHAIDLGCGTGLMGERLRVLASFLEGMDISAEMLKRAEDKRIYDRLARRDLLTLSALPTGADLVTAADVFMYVGALQRIFETVAGNLQPGGVFAFSVESHAGAEEMVLRPSRRYAHAPAHVRALLAGAGFDIASFEIATIRIDRDEPVEGLIVVAVRRDAAAEVGEIVAAVEAPERPPAH
ncbi:class I SAM-dependent DNA methyltransferase [Chelativorans salis]|uniref:Methyltransferase domain-containing protein n=1 Tax=Chelativorans salis TaxID=2978478 RepID=A0ABT2LIS2_9HYPH|nr:methyltransferase [Chelativorans sp. EGI FJ00035]MCT7374482.1 methyltransferase domain-containing protein [Chelativorans sp. EGI FJ00035]